ncbi:MAG: flagellar motor switch protein FliN [Treponema sp.]|jgi:flagellar motor switch protein FliN/FliY|nr:flagellar motor switch protein FliN [Treponema sp.]
MSDGALSQAEIDALLSGVDGGSGTTASVGPAGSEADRKALQDFLASTVDAQSSNLSMMTGSQVVITGPQGSYLNRDALLGQLPDTITAVKADFSSGFPGEHLYLMSEDTAKSIAGLMNKEENIELDEMAMSVIGEAVGTIVGSQITALTGKTGNKSIANVPPEATNVPKAVVALPGGDFYAAAYQMDLGDGQAQQFWEIFGPSVAADVARALSPQPAASAPNPGPMPTMMMGGGGGGMPQGAMVGQTANVQSVQFPSLVPHATPQEAGNISLIMDVYMEMTVELGRTRKLIKEILGMGEGTIIELDKLAGEPVDILVNHKLIAKGEVVVIDENFGVRVTEIVSPQERMIEMS